LPCPFWYWISERFSAHCCGCLRFWCYGWSRRKSSLCSVDII